MPNKIKSKIQEQTKNRVRLHRGIKSIMKQDTISLVNAIQLKKKLFQKNVPASNENIEPPKLSDKLRSWAIEYHITRRALTALLKILKSFGMQSLPVDSRCLLKTPRSIEIEARAGGQYWHNGLANVLSQVFRKLSTNLRTEVNVNMDGLPLHKSSPKCFWPILINLHGSYSVLRDTFETKINSLNEICNFKDFPEINPMIVGIWCGFGKPSNVNEFLVPFINEMNAIARNGVTINGHRLDVDIRCMICDSPARSFLKGLNSFFLLLLPYIVS